MTENKVEEKKTEYGTVAVYDDGTALNDYSFLSHLIETKGIGKGFLYKLNRWLKKQTTFNRGETVLYDEQGKQNKENEIIDAQFYKSVKAAPILKTAKKYKEPILRIKLLDREYSYNANADIYCKPNQEDADAGTSQANDQDNYYLTIYFNEKKVYISSYMAKKFPDVLKQLHLTFAKHFNPHTKRGKRISITIPENGTIASMLQGKLYPRQYIGFALEEMAKAWIEKEKAWPAFRNIVGSLEVDIRQEQKITIPELAKKAGCSKKTVYHWLHYVKNQVKETHDFIAGKGKQPGYFEKKEALA